MNFSSWTTLPEDKKIDLLREEVLQMKRLLQYGVAGACAVGTILGSLVTVLVEHFWR